MYSIYISLLKNCYYFFIATCDVKDAIKNEKVKLDSEKSTYVQDQQVKIQCDMGYEMANGSDPAIVRVCLSNQTWSGEDPKCTPSK